MWLVLEFFATAHSFRERSLESVNCTGLTLPMSMGFSASSHHAGMSAPAHHAQMSTPTYHSGMSAPTHHSGLSEPTQHAGVFYVLSLPVCWLQRTSVDCLRQSTSSSCRHAGKFSSVIIGIFVPEIDIFVSSTGNSNISIWTKRRS